MVVDDEAILKMIPTVSADSGIFPEPAAAAAFAGLAEVAEGSQGSGPEVGALDRGGGHLHRIGVEGHPRGHGRDRKDRRRTAPRPTGSGWTGPDRDIHENGTVAREPKEAGMIDLTVAETALEVVAAPTRERRVRIPTLAPMRDPRPISSG